MAAARTDLKVLVLPGDGIGPEVTAPAVDVLTAAAARGGLAVTLESAPFGGAAIDAEGCPVSPATMDLARAADAVLLGAVGGPRWDDQPGSERPEAGLLALRRELDLFANLRPIRVLPGLEDASALRPAAVQGLDLLIVRELVAGIYFGEPRGTGGAGDAREAFNTMRYTAAQISRVAEVAFRAAQGRTGRLVSVDKANVLEVSVLWRTVLEERAAAHPGVALTHQYVDNCAMQLVLNPRQFDVLVTGNLFGDILSDAAAAVTGSLGLLPSASLGADAALYEPVHGSAPELAGRDQANPLAAILSVALLLTHTAGRPDLAREVEAAVVRVLARGLRTPDLGSGATPGGQTVGTAELGRAVVRELAAAGDQPRRSTP